eukprot:TRINITY_DN1801_c0_g2_i9.p1 TRINITY_DN1801_c0_g2~~TRINITY_DN1801_c0_g2_i9.p1  ORF type:complete len:203 (+),score=36.00 TRINITY_DN1801_c0_g2_i9:575-1183(+)
MVSAGMFEKWFTGGQRQSTSLEKSCAAIGGGVISAFIYTPAEMVTIQQQKLGKGFTSTISHISSSRGFLSLWRGNMFGIIREGCYVLGYLAIADIVKEEAMQRSAVLKSNEFGAQVFGACVGGMVGCFLSNPFDVTKTRLQGALEPGWSPGVFLLNHIYKTEGVRSLYRALLPRTVRACIAAFIIQFLRNQMLAFKAAQMNE